MNRWTLTCITCGGVLAAITSHEVFADSGGNQHWVELGTTAPITPLTGGHFGGAMDEYGGLLLIGAPYQGTDPFEPVGPGFAEIGTRQGDSRYQLIAPNIENGDEFGGRVSIAPNLDSVTQSPLAFVSAPRHANDASEVLAGAVYSFAPDATGGYSWQQTITPSDSSAAQMFGVSVDFDGHTLAVGAHRDSTNAWAGGCAYLYTIGPDGMATNEVRIDPDLPHDSQYFGFSISIDGDQLAVGAFADSSVKFLGGAVYLFSRQSDGTWIQTDRIEPDELLDADYFSTAVTLKDDVLVVSSSNRRIGGSLSVGRVYVFRKIHEQWTQTQTIDPPIVAPNVYWGISISMQNDLLAIGGNGWVNNGIQTGAVSVLQDAGDDTYELVQTVLAGGIGEQGGFGVTVALAGEDLLVGAPEYASPDGGTVHTFGPTCLGDLDGDHTAAVTDMISIIGHWNETGIMVQDLDQNFEVGIGDLLLAMAGWGACP
ncbi:MAG: FG-GAP repeat protein [Phycisphaerales bacterium]|nr:FG-GAP repeat protein [Phycisphaerales bacterium]